MKIEAMFLLFLGVFFGIVGTVYWFWSYEDGGTMMLIGTAALGFLPGLLLLLLAQAIRRAEVLLLGPGARRGRPAVRQR